MSHIAIGALVITVLLFKGRIRVALVLFMVCLMGYLYNTSECVTDVCNSVSHLSDYLGARI